VDDAIIDVENVWRRLRTAPAEMSPRALVLAASVEVRSAVVYATVMVALVFLPVFLLGGLEGALFRPLATAYVLATLSSLLVALTVTPALALVLLPAIAARRAQAPWLVTTLRTRYERALKRSSHVPPSPSSQRRRARCGSSWRSFCGSSSPGSTRPISSCT
jgi:Cu/Ag efflux pump CusA